MSIKSHPDKLLEVHMDGVCKKSVQYVSLPIVRVAALFHDIGKINPNFQKKLAGQKTAGYANHAYLSVLAFVYYVKANPEAAYTWLEAVSQADFKIKVLQTVALIAYHHGDLPDFEKLPNRDEADAAGEFANEENLAFSDFLATRLGIKHLPFSVCYDAGDFGKTGWYIKIRNGKQWQLNALNYFMDTQFAFAALIHADKRDAGNLVTLQFDEQIHRSIAEIDGALTAKFELFDHPAVVSELNRLRTAIRIEATQNIAKFLESSQRVYTLTAPTGAGKTYTLLSVAKEIQRQKGKLGIIYALPFLSITEQVQAILDEDGIDYLPVNSKANNIELINALNAYENTPTPANLHKVLSLDFAEHTFDHPFIITTFVQFFETLVSNENATLLKLPYFSNRIFLIDELQALPPRLYIFFSAWLEAFCRKFNSYAILSTATMPNLEFPRHKEFLNEEKDPKRLFKEYSCNLPKELIDPQKYFSQKIFNRYVIRWIKKEPFLLEDLAEHILARQESCLVILNTIGDTKALYERLVNNAPEVILLNTHFIPADRRAKIERVKAFLNAGEKVILISTQLIEAGVDIDFPVVYRDLCPLPSLIQSAGRCNRNNRLGTLGNVYFFQLKKAHGRPSSEVIYTDMSGELLNFCKEHIKDGMEENQLFTVQDRFFTDIKNNWSIGSFKVDGDLSFNMIECVNKAEFKRLGRFQLIDKKSFGEEYQYYIPSGDEDIIFTLLAEKADDFERGDYETFRKNKIKMNNNLKQLGDRILNVRIKRDMIAPCFSDTYLGIRILSSSTAYSFETGLDLGTENLLL